MVLCLCLLADTQQLVLCRYGDIDLGSQVAAELAGQRAGPRQPGSSGQRRAEQAHSLGDDASQWAELSTNLQAPGANSSHLCQDMIPHAAWAIQLA